MQMVNPHVLIEMTDEPDCRFVAAWLFRAAQAQSFWKALGDGEFADQIGPLCADAHPDLAAFALEVLGELEHRRHVLTLDLYSDDDTLISYEFALMERLGFFIYGSESYWMVVPTTVTLAAVKRAALELLSTAKDDGYGIEIIRPEHLLKTLSKMEVEALESRLIAVRRFNSNHRHYSGPTQ